MRRPIRKFVTFQDTISPIFLLQVYRLAVAANSLVDWLDRMKHLLSDICLLLCILWQVELVVRSTRYNILRPLSAMIMKSCCSITISTKALMLLSYIIARSVKYVLSYIISIVVFVTRLNSSSPLRWVICRDFIIVLSQVLVMFVTTLDQGRHMSRNSFGYHPHLTSINYIKNTRSLIILYHRGWRHEQRINSISYTLSFTLTSKGVYLTMQSVENS